MTRLLVVCVDGATPATARDGGFFALGGAGNPLRPLRSIYPASTAPAHASMLTGCLPSDHGVVANRYWEDESVAVIRRSQDPLAALHPYDHHALRVPSVLDGLRARGLSTAAVMFPQTFSLRGEGGAEAAAFCCYIPTEHHDVPPAGAQVRVAGLGFDLRLSTAVTPGGTSVGLTEPGSNQTWMAAPDRPADVVWSTGRWALSFRIVVEEARNGHVRLCRGTAVGVLTSGAAVATKLLAGQPTAHSLAPAYTASGRTDYFEAPAATWVTHAALTLLDRDPDVMFVRYNQIDHAQEHLHWHTVHGDPGVRQSAREQVDAAYRDVEREVTVLRLAIGPQVPTLLFSDHGIVDVSREIDPNAALDELGLETDFVFQGDSHIAFLYGDRPLRETERTRLLKALPAVTEVTTAQLARLGIYAPGRCGQLALRTPAHTAFEYSGVVADAAVRRATHGFDPDQTAMNGLVNLLGRWPRVPAPRSLLDLSALVDAVTAHVSQCASRGAARGPDLGGPSSSVG